MQTLNWNQLDNEAQTASLRRSPLVGDNTLEQQVSEIISTVRQRGDAALREYSRRFDKTEIQDIRLSDADINAASARVSDELKAAIQAAMANIRRFHEAQKPGTISLETQAGIRCELHSEAIAAVGLYIPGGSAPLISTVMMLALPANIAGCERRVLVSPPPIDDAIVYAATACGVNEIYQVGGAQAIAALAFGTKSITPVDKIFGPGNRYVTEAKSQVSRDNQACVSIDMPAGPSEVLVIADAKANPVFVAADLLSQAEHGPDSQVMLVTDSDTLARAVAQEVERQLAALPRAEIARKALFCSRTLIVKDMQQAVQVSNRYGPEHLILQTQQPRELLMSIRAAGSVFVGPYTPESVGDYASGTNHVLPTYGYSRTVSSLSLADFCRRFTVQELSAEGLSRLGNTVMTLAAAEQLDAHKNAVALRLATLDVKGEAQ
ncbi:MAG: histidinol dehydrogenase [Shewanella sp.]|jgi:histidinol dehydrogenase|uniref:histidinol dehydrogenase n=1 Tax=Shewanella TaxID=22 RepID=UPI00167AFC29|nr:histidinol dehydrogenase [Shewanella fodinae]MCL2905404.1 histidinol dehydrogenase [Shewanella fodinae]MDN5368761.1 histidinol dehydrogenase [Shewanella sp.]GGY90792.1 histidinol dehydrogenase [Shewanella fodinae]